MSQPLVVNEGEINVTLPNGEVRKVEKGTTPLQIAESISGGLARNTLAAKVNGTVTEAHRPLQEDAELQLLTWHDPEGKAAFWHSSAHILAEALEYFYPGINLGIGPPIEDGFYYDIDFKDYDFSEEDFEKIEKKFLELAKSGETFQRKEVSKAEALQYFREKGDELKLDLIQDLNDGEITFYESGDFVDLCKGGHVANSKVIKAVKLLNVAGAYWRGDSDNKMLTRIYGISFPKKKELTEYLEYLEEAKARDHRKLGKELDMFSFHEEGPGFPFWHHNGMVVFNELARFMRNKLINDYDYQEIRTPMILNEELWKQSGHWQNYRENMYFTDIDEQSYAVKPMNCPGSTIVYRSNPYSYRDLPVRMFEFGMVHRHELSGVLTGLFRVRAFTQDDAHIFCLPEHVQQEIETLIKLLFEVYAVFGFHDVQVFLSTRPEKYIGELEVWDRSEAALQSALEAKGIDYQLNPGDGAFYGPKIDFVVRDSLKREWQLGTIQLDFSMPKRFGLEYKGSDSQMHTPVMIHRAILGSFERFIGVLLEHTAGKLPLWLAPQQGILLPISERFNDNAAAMQKALMDAGLRVDLDDRDERVGRKIRDAEVRKIPYMFIIGEKEAESNSLSIRKQGEEDGEMGQKSLEDTVALLKAAVEASYVPETAEKSETN